MSGRVFWSLWSWHPSVLAGCTVLLVAYLVLSNLHLTRRAVLYGLGLLVLLIALVSPIDALGDTYLFSAHMAQHLLLLLVAPPLLLLGIPPEMAARALRLRFMDRLERAVSQPLVAWILGMGVMWLWHYPLLYNASLADEGVHLLEHLSFLVTATIFWWPIVAPLEERRMRLIISIPYLFFASAASGTLGIFLAFAHPGLYPAYLAPDDRYGILSLIREKWGISPANDQQAGGLLMWVAGTPVYLSGALYSLVRWYGSRDDGEKLHE